MSITHFTGLNRTAALPLAVKAWVELIDAGHCSNVVQLSHDDDAILVSVHGDPAGVITYRHEPTCKQLSICLGYILPQYRGKGLYRTLWDALVSKAQDLGAVHIHSATFLDNDHMRKVAKAQGRVERTVTLDFEVPPK